MTVIDMSNAKVRRRVQMLTIIRGLKLELGGIKLPRNANPLHAAQRLLPDAKIRTRKQAFLAVVDAAQTEFAYVLSGDMRKTYNAARPKSKAKPARKAA